MLYRKIHHTLFVNSIKTDNTMTHYPTQLDEIDQWLADNFGILPGACSSTENLRHNTARLVAEALWPKKDHIADDSKKDSGDSKKSNELEEAARKYSERTRFHWPNQVRPAYDAFIAGANWQKEQDHDACYQCEKAYDNVFFKGEQHAIKRMKEEATEATVYEDAGGYPFVPAIEMYDYDKDEPTAKKGDKVKIIILKDE